ncbi:hypothetical protein EJ03DRAFT_330168 [Teratosphaeria nubilosa]|uniref:NAD(P)-binding protein n=1 Tax=Teratosphaeria nubilosa TaxID=161662 RepID=A0A6G1L066_9PEZI|nr:hypothetical protein EJ03DRAFT_330168 [Teratosphaeria nubilosa]
MPLTWITAYEALVERLEIKEEEKCGILIVNGAGGVGSVASQIARQILKLPVVVTTTSRDETTKFSTEMGATHTVNHREDIVQQIKDLKLDVPIAPFGKVCSIVQDKEMPLYGTEWIAKSLTYVWCLLGTKPYYGVDVDSHGKILRDLARWVDEGLVKCHHTETLPLTVDGVRKAHREIEGGAVIGKLALSLEHAGNCAFT